MNFQHISVITAMFIGFSAVLSYSTIASSSEVATGTEAKDMLENVIEARKKDKSAAVAAINDGDTRFRDRDIYPFCIETTGDYIVVAHGRPDHVVGLRADQVIDKNGTIIAGQMLPFAIEGQI